MTPGLVWRVLRAEGVAAVADRLSDRLAEARRRRSFRPAAAPPPGFRAAVLNLAAAAPAPRLGGVQAQLLWRLQAEAARRPVALLYPEPAAAGGGYRLELQDGRQRRALFLPPTSLHREASVPPGATAPGPLPDAGRQAPPGFALEDPELERAVAWAAARCGAAALQVEGLAEMPLASLLRLRQKGLAMILAVHDFAAFCPRPHLLEAVEPPAAPRFCHYSRDAERCTRCLGRGAGGAGASLAAGYQEGRRELARRLLASAAAVVYPSPFLALTHGGLFSGAGEAAARVIAPAGPPVIGEPGTREPMPAGPAGSGSGRSLVAQPAEPRISGPARPALPRVPRHVAWVGAVQAHKGALVFEAAVRHLAASGRRLRLSAYGGGDPGILARWRRLPGLRVRGYYRAGSLPALLRRDGVDLALLLSVVPESYGLALDECAAAGVPAVAFDLGAPAERIAAAGSGLLLAAPLADDPAAGGAALAVLIADLLDGRLDVPPPPPPALPASPAASRPSGSAAAAAAAWAALYRDLALPGC